MKPLWKKKLESDEEGEELWLGVPTWDTENKAGKLSIKFAYLKDGRVPRTAPEVPEDVVIEMLIMLAENGRISPEKFNRIEEMLKRWGRK